MLDNSTGWEILIRSKLKFLLAMNGNASGLPRPHSTLSDQKTEAALLELRLMWSGRGRSRANPLTPSSSHNGTSGAWKCGLKATVLHSGNPSMRPRGRHFFRLREQEK